MSGESGGPPMDISSWPWWAQLLMAAWIAIGVGGPLGMLVGRHLRRRR